MRPPEEFWYWLGFGLFVLLMAISFALLKWAGVDV